MTVLLTTVAIPAESSAAGDAKAGAKLAAASCAKCHGKTGKGDGESLERINADVTPVDWTNKALMAKWSDQELHAIIRLGGKGVGKSKIMPAFETKLSDAQIVDLVAYIRSLAK